MKKIKFFLITIGIFIINTGSTIESQPIIFEKPLSPRVANYNIKVSLDTKKRFLEGNEKLTWYNKSNDIIHELQFHLYMNAFRNNKSTFMIESRGRSRGFEIDKKGWGFIDITSMVLNSTNDVTSTIQFIQPDDGNSTDKTVARVPLPKPLQPGDSIVVTIKFKEVLPQPPFARSGAKEEYFFIGQWFPKIGVYINGAWNCHQYHSNSEFFADFGVYDVYMTVPEKNVVGATGLEVKVTDNGDGTATHYYHAEDVHDFAWTTSPEFIVHTTKVQDVEVKLLLQPDHADQAQRHLDAAKVGIEYFQNWYGDYPYPNLTIVDPRRGAGGSGGMEYPTLITAGTTYGLPDGIRLPEMVIIHEFGHNYWYHLVASNEFEESWLDEGINTYSEMQIIRDHYGPEGNMIDFLGIKLSDLQMQRASYISLPDADTTIRKAWEFYSGNSYGVNSYAKPGLMLTTLQNYIGQDVMSKIMRTYFERYKFKHPTTADFIAVVNEVTAENPDWHKDQPIYSKINSKIIVDKEVSPPNFNWYFDQALRSNAVLDYSVDMIRSYEISTAKGFDYTYSIDSIAEDSKESYDDERDDTIKSYITEVRVRRLGDFIFPAEIECAVENGEKIREKWDGQELWKKYRFEKPTKIVYATVDPDNKIPIDINYINNSKTLDFQGLGVNKIALQFMFWMQTLLDQPEYLNILTFLPTIF
jgi:hypothetical protein